jgi:hypothetical protein
MFITVIVIVCDISNDYLDWPLEGLKEYVKRVDHH